MATGGFRSNTATDFLEEWKAKREKMRAKMPGGISASTGSSIGALHGGSNKNETRSLTPATEAGGSAPERAAATVTCAAATVTCAPCHPAVRAAASCEPRAADGPPATPKKASQLEKEPGTPQADTGDNDRESPAPGGGTGKSKEKKSSGPSARKGKGQIEKRKLREKRRSTGVVSIPSNESLDELDDDDGSNKERETEEALTQHNTFQNESMSTDPEETPRGMTARYKSTASPAADEEPGGNGKIRQGNSRHSGLERRVEELEKELAGEQQENSRLLAAHQEKDDLIEKLREEVDLLNRDLDELEDENEQLKQENKTLLKVVGQLTR
ncbi:PRKC apoptosis WT1 regulator protein [Paramormyrops kingsleyae]|uniref:Pro-apoptotic WT1 regulator n=1 Tax=Paramormyrops kingsleyae TaxID=1676925 RepID=A0A3B3RJ27_9TELE|nr:PRKC apoptosis WT1 regulator protein-like [Paramormyrops kingsleyae]